MLRRTRGFRRESLVLKKTFQHTGSRGGGGASKAVGHGFEASDNATAYVKVSESCRNVYLSSTVVACACNVVEEYRACIGGRRARAQSVEVDGGEA